MKSAQQMRIGILNDLHYDGGIEAMNRLYESVSMLNKANISTLIILGDLIDSGNQSNALRLLREVSALCKAFRGIVHFLPGNHDLDFLSKNQFYTVLGCADITPAFRFQLSDIDCICIDGNFNPDGSDYEDGNFEWNHSYVPEQQLAWLQKQLENASAPTLLFSHQRIDIPGDYSVQNQADVRTVIRGSGKVKAVFQGHQHEDDLQTIDGTSYYTLGAHKDGAGPAVATVDERGILLIRDFSPSPAGTSNQAPVNTA